MIICTCPVAVRSISIREEVVSLDGPGFVGAVQSIHIAGRGGVEDLYAGILNNRGWEGLIRLH